MTDIKERIFTILRTVGRQGTEAVIAYLQSSSYFTRGCHSHHWGHGGLAKHSVEVYEHMLANAGGFSADTIAVAALFHDLGKTVPRDKNGFGHGRGHGVRSVAILDYLGYPLTDDERRAICIHHVRKPWAWAHPLRRALSTADQNSARHWWQARKAAL